MRIFRRRAGHVRLETLSEYLDGRLSDDERRRVERHLESCSRCASERASLEYTVGLVRRAPVLRPRRSFTLSEAPVAQKVPRPRAVPVWAYGAAASVAIVLFAVILSADLAGSLAQDVPVPESEGPAIETAPAAGLTVRSGKMGRAWW